MDSSIKSVKLSCNSCNYRMLDNIGIVNLPVNDNEKINMPLLFKNLKEETESEGLKMGVNIDISLVRIGTERIGDIDVPFFTFKTVMQDVIETLQKIYIYQKSDSALQIIATSGTIDGLSDIQKNINLILKTIQIK